MGIFDGALIACDIDGTIMTGGVIPQKNIDAIEYFKSEGGNVCLATGRTAPALNPVLSQYNGYGPCVVGNGSMIYDSITGEILYEVCIEKSEFSCVEAALLADPTVGIELHAGRTVYKLTVTEETVVHQRYELIDAVPITLEEAKKLNLNKILYLFENEEQKKRVKDAVLAAAKESSFSDTYVMIEGKMRIYLEHMPKEVSKSATLLRMLDITGARRDRFFAIGDGFNDIDMLKTSSFSACPAGAPEEVKCQADIIVGEVQNGALADFIDIIKRRLNNGCKD